MTSFLGLYKTEIGDSLKQVVNRRAHKERVEKDGKKS